jgi:hypothetical protein
VGRGETILEAADVNEFQFSRLSRPSRFAAGIRQQASGTRETKTRHGLIPGGFLIGGLFSSI